MVRQFFHDVQGGGHLANGNTVSSPAGKQQREEQQPPPAGMLPIVSSIFLSFGRFRLPLVDQVVQPVQELLFAVNLLQETAPAPAQKANLLLPAARPLLQRGKTPQRVPIHARLLQDAQMGGTSQVRLGVERRSVRLSFPLQQPVFLIPLCI